MPVELIVPGRSRKTIVDCSMPHDAGTPSAASTSARAQPGSVTQSLFSVATHSPVEASMPRLQPSAKPTLSGLREEPAGREVGRDHLSRAVSRAVVDDKDLDVAIRLRREGPEARPQILA